MIRQNATFGNYPRVLGRHPASRKQSTCHWARGGGFDGGGVAAIRMVGVARKAVVAQGGVSTVYLDGT